MLFQLLYQIMMILSYPLCCGLITLYENLASTIEYLNTKIPNNHSSVLGEYGRRPPHERKQENAQTASGLILRYMRAHQTATTWVM